MDVRKAPFQAVLLRAVSPPNDADVQRLLGLNCQLHEQVRAVGGTHYPADWRAHYGPRYPEVVRAKSCYDPKHVLAPGQGILHQPS